MKVLVVLNSLSLGGIELMFLRALPELKEAGVQVDFALHELGHVLDPEFEQLGCRLWKLSKRASPRSAAQDLSRLLSAHDYDRMHSQFGYTAGGHVLGAKWAGVPGIVSFHAATPTSLYDWADRPILGRLRWMWLQWHRRLILENATEIVGHSQANLDAFNLKWRESSIPHRVIENAVSFPEFAPQSGGDRLRLLHVGSLRSVKNHAELLRILQALRKRGVDAHLSLVGDGPLRAKLEQEVRERGLGEHVRFAGLLRNTSTVYGLADVFVFPSFSEGFANVLVEAQGCGLPIVASDIPGHRESVHSSQHRFLYRLGDISGAVGRILEQKDAKDSAWVKEAKEAVRKRFTVERFADDLLRLYRDHAPALR